MVTFKIIIAELSGNFLIHGTPELKAKFKILVKGRA
jgi:hypothetical protein